MPRPRGVFRWRGRLQVVGVRSFPLLSFVRTHKGLWRCVSSRATPLRVQKCTEVGLRLGEHLNHGSSVPVDGPVGHVRDVWTRSADTKKLWETKKPNCRSNTNRRDNRSARYRSPYRRFNCESYHGRLLFTEKPALPNCPRWTSPLILSFSQP